MLHVRASEAAEFLLGRGFPPPQVGVVLGSGLGGLVDCLEGAKAIRYGNVPHFPEPTVAGHAGNLVFGTIGGSSTLMLQGRFHHYEGHDLGSVTFPIRVLQRLGAKSVILTAASGGLREGFGPGTLVRISDHLNLMGGNPLRGTNDERLGTRFPDMTNVYSARLGRIAVELASEMGIALAEGVYAAVPGPSYETPAEVRMLRVLGADIVGMSTVPEAIVARHAGMEVLAFGAVANWGAGIAPEPLSHEEVLAAMDRSGPRLAELIAAMIPRIDPSA